MAELVGWYRWLNELPHVRHEYDGYTARRQAVAVRTSSSAVGIRFSNLLEHSRHASASRDDVTRSICQRRTEQLRITPPSRSWFHHPRAVLCAITAAKRQHTVCIFSQLFGFFNMKPIIGERYCKSGSMMTMTNIFWPRLSHVLGGAKQLVCFFFGAHTNTWMICFNTLLLWRHRMRSFSESEQNHSSRPYDRACNAILHQTDGDCENFCLQRHRYILDGGEERWYEMCQQDVRY